MIMFNGMSNKSTTQNQYINMNLFEIISYLTILSILNISSIY